MNHENQLPNEFDLCATDAALYSLGVLPHDEAAAIRRRLESGCPLCSKLANDYAEVAEHLALAATAVEPPVSLRQRVLDRIQAKQAPPAEPSEQMKIVRGHDSPWIKMPFPGVEIRPLVGDKTLMVRMQPGAVFPEHDHPHAEQCYVLEGSITDSDGITLNAGDFVVMSSGMTHEPLHTDTGCLLFVAYAD